MTFITNKGLYYYKVMPFSFKNVGAIYQRLVNKVFKNRIDCNMKIYVDDILVNSKKTALHIDDLAKAFDILRGHQMNQNPTKCTFGMTSKKFLNFMVTRRGIEANPEKIKAILDMKPLTSR